MLVLDVMFFCMNLFMFLEILWSLEGFVADLNRKVRPDHGGGNDWRRTSQRWGLRGVWTMYVVSTGGLGDKKAWQYLEGDL